VGYLWFEILWNFPAATRGSETLTVA